MTLDRPGILGWLRETDGARLEELWRAADEVRRAHVGDEVHLRGLVEISSHCLRRCHYCGLRAGNRGITGRIRKLGREIGQGPGASPNLRRRRKTARFERVTTRPGGLGRP